MNKQDYDKYYQQGGSYVIPVEIFNELFEDYECFKNDCKKYKEVTYKIQKHCEIEINASNHYLENHSSQKELCHKVAHQRILDIIKEVE